MVAAVSGGPDSVALARALVLARPHEPLVLAHLNHQLRGAESDADEKFVVQLHQQLVATISPAPTLSVDRRDVASAAVQAGMNLEATARDLRYDWLASVAAQTSSAWIATGHTLDDQAETVLHRLLRGTGIRGLRGIAAQRRIRPGVTVLRPLLEVSRAEVHSFLADLGQPSRDDSSNRDLKYTRNRLRLELLPLLEQQYNPAIRSVLARLGQQAHELFTELEGRAAALLALAERPAAGELRILDRHVLLAAPELVTREALRLLWETAGWPMAKMDFHHWHILMAVFRAELPAADFPGGVRARGRDAVVQFGQTHGTK